MKEPISLHENTLYLIGQIDKTVRDKIILTIQQLGYDVSPEQFAILVILHYQDGIIQAEIAEAVNRDKTTVSRVLGRMEKSGLITKKSEADNKRINKIFITAKGKKIQQKLITATGPIYRMALHNICEEDNEIINRILLKILHNVTKL